MNLLFSFNSPGDRDTFLDRVRGEDARLLEHAYLGKRRPDAVFQSLSENEASRLRQLAEGLGRAFDDVRFDPMEPR